MQGFLVTNLEEKNRVEDLVIYGRIILKLISSFALRLYNGQMNESVDMICAMDKWILCG